MLAATADVGFSRQFDGYSHQRCWINEPSLQNDAAARRVYGLLTRYQVITAIHSPPQGGSGRDRLLCRGLLQTTRAMPRQPAIRDTDVEITIRMTRHRTAHVRA